MTNESDGVLAYHRLRTALTRFQSTPERLSPGQLKQLDQLAARELEIESAILGAPEAQGVVVPASSVAAAVGELRGRYADDAQFELDLQNSGLDSVGLETALTRQLRVESVMERVAARTVQVSELDAQIHYYTHAERYRLPETRSASHILITINEDFAENSRSAAWQRLGLIRGRLLKKPNRFAEQATKHSECPTAMNGGQLGRVQAGQLYESLERVLFALPEGGISEVLESPLGFHLLLCESIHAAGPVTLQEALPSIVKHLQDRRQRICQQSWLSQLLHQSGLANSHAA